MPTTTGGTPPPLSPTAQAIADARAKAKTSGQAVVVDALTTATSQTVVNPNATLSTTDYAAPVRVQQGTSWAAIDTTLHSNADGTLSPAVTPASLTLSGGGSGPLATLTTSDGKQLAVSAPFTLPAPIVSGDTATYPGVLTSDVDLQVTALPAGGWRDVIVVKTAAAAANPALKDLHFPISATGLVASTGSAGDLSFTDASGAVRLHAPTPLQWDSTLAPPAAVGSSSANRMRSLFASPSMASAPSGASSSQGPGDSANVATIGVAANSSSIDLTPDQSALGQGTGPWYIDPSISVSSTTQAWDQVQENHPDTSNYNAPGALGTGYCGYSNCTGYGRYRSYFQIGINPNIYNQPNGAPSPPTIYNSTLYATASDASSPSTPTPLGLYWTPPFDNTTTWNHNQPCGTGSTMGGCQKVGQSFPITGAGPIKFDVTSQMQQAAQQHWANWTVGIAPDDENNALYRHHISIDPGSAPYITTNYDMQPSAWSPRTSPQPGFASSNTHFDCTSGGANPWDNVGWIGANQNITLTVNNWSPSNQNLHTAFNLFWGSNGTENLDSGWAGPYNNPNGVSVNVGSLTDGQVYGWHAGSYDADPTSNGLGSPWTPLCYFGIDRTPPTVSISSTDFPPSGSPNPKPTKYAGQSGTFTLHGTDPTPSSGGSTSGVACFRVSSDPSPVTGWKCTDGPGNGVVSSGNSTFNYTPGNWGTNIVYAQAQDNAGNYSQVAAYAFYAPWNPQSSAVFGDVTGDGKPDIVLPDAAGNLKLISTTTDPTNATSARATLSPNGKTWNSIQLTHRGSLLPNTTVDDLIAHAAGSVDLSLYLNDGHGVYTAAGPVGQLPTDCRDATGAPLAGGCPSGFANSDWSQVSQFVALGTPEGENNTPSSVTRTSLVAVINGQLWLFHGAAQGDKVDYLDGTARLLSSANWSNYDLLNPGPANGVTPGTSARQPTLWARNRADGTLHAYRILGGTTPDYSDIADPAAKGVTLPGINLPTSTYPAIGSSGDLNGDGVPDLWATTATGQLALWTGTSQDGTGNTPVSGFNSASFPTNLTNLPTPLGLWKLAGADTSGAKTADSLGQDTTNALGTHPGTLNNVAFSPDNPTGSAPTNVAVFNGTNSKIESSGPIVDTTKSFTINTWVKPNSQGGVVVSQDGNTTAGFMLWPNNGTWEFAMATGDTTGWPYDTTSTTNTNAAVQGGAWTHLIASYNATTGQMALYVNGNLAATGTHQPGPAFNGNLAIGRWQNYGTQSNFFSGSISDVAIYTYPTTPGTTTGAIVAGNAAAKCLDLHQATPGTPVQIWDCNGTAAQKWTTNPNGTVNMAGGCLDAMNAGTGDGTLVQWTNCDGYGAQQWIPRADGSIYNPASGRCLDDPNGVTDNGTHLQLYDCNGTPSQRWTVTATA